MRNNTDDIIQRSKEIVLLSFSHLLSILINYDITKYFQSEYLI